MYPFIVIFLCCVTININIINLIYATLIMSFDIHTI